MSLPKQSKYEAKNLAMKAEILEAVREGKFLRQANVSFSSFVEIDNGVAICSMLSDNELINVMLGNGENDNETDVKEAALCATIMEPPAVLTVLEPVPSKMLAP